MRGSLTSGPLPPWARFPFSNFMARKSKSVGFPRALRRTKAFVIANLVIWGAIGGWYFFQPPVRLQEVTRLVGNLFDSRKQITAFEVAARVL